jgi:peroxiredoxin
VSDESSNVIEKYTKDNKITFRLASEPSKKAARQYGVSGIPAAYLIDVNGTIAWEGSPRQVTDDVIAPLLKEVKKPEAEQSDPKKE